MLRYAGSGTTTLPLIKLRRIIKHTQEAYFNRRLLRLDVWVVVPLSASFRVFVNSRTFCKTKTEIKVKDQRTHVEEKYIYSCPKHQCTKKLRSLIWEEEACYVFLLFKIIKINRMGVGSINQTNAPWREYYYNMKERNRTEQSSNY